MKAKKLVYWGTTSVFALMMIGQAYAYLTMDMFKGAFTHLGFPDYFRIELAIAKFIGAFLLVLPMVKGRVKEWAYAGFAITLFSGFVAHFAKGDPASTWIAPLIVLGILIASYVSYHKKRD